MKDIINKLKFNTYKKNIMITLIFIILIILVFISISFAYMNTTQDEVVITSVDAEAGQVDDLTFTTGNTLTFTSGAGNLSGSTDVSATLTKHPLRENADSTYNVSIDVSENTFVYTTEELTAELILTVTDPFGEVIEEAYGLEFVTVDGVSGFDVTNFKEAILLVGDYPITTTSTTTDTFTLTLTLLDLPSNQTENNNKTFTAEILMNGHNEKLLLNELVIAHNGGREYIEIRENPDFKTIASTDEGMFDAEDNYGTSYYFRGAVEDNWVFFAGYYWKIIRINGDGSIRLYYMGKDKPTYITRVNGGPNNYVNKGKYNNIQSLAEHTGYMYTEGEQHGLTTDSNAKTIIDNWFFTYMIDYNTHLSDTLFCVDRTVTSGTGIGTEATSFSVIGRLTGEVVYPTLKCENILDNFTVDDVVNGNGALTYPVALMTADEVALSGTPYNVVNPYNYTTDNKSYFWLTTPWSLSQVSTNGDKDAYYSHYYYGARLGGFPMDMILYSGKWSGSFPVSYRPVVNLKNNTLVSGKGLWDDPYIVDGFVINKYN